MKLMEGCWEVNLFLGPYQVSVGLFTLVFFQHPLDGPTKTIGYHSKSMHQQRYGKWFIPFLSHILQVYLYQ